MWKLNYNYGELQTDNTVDASKNSGNIARQTINFNGLANPIIQNYKYDSLDRITEAKETANSQTSWQQNFGYDRYGNRTTFSQVVNGNQLPMNNFTMPNIDADTNRITTGQGYVYDGNGNLIQDANGRQFTFNGDNKQTQVKDVNNQVIGQYLYDGSGKRIKKVTTSETTIFVYSGSKLIAEYSTQLATNPTTSYTVTDMLGSPRVITDTTGQVISRRDFMAFGEEIATNVGGRTTANKYGQSDSVRQRFTGYQKDDETGLDFAEARYYNDAHGRFTAVDPLLASGKSVNPQTFNRYVYSMNRPLLLTDPTGMQVATNPNKQKEIPSPPQIDLKIVSSDKYGNKTEKPLTEKQQESVDKLVQKNWRIIYNTAVDTAARNNLPPTETKEVTNSKTDSTQVAVSGSTNPNATVTAGRIEGNSTTSSAVPSLEDQINNNTDYINNNAIFIKDNEGSVDNAPEGAAIINSTLRQEATRLVEGGNQIRLPDETFRRYEEYRTNQGIRPPRVGPYPIYRPNY